MGDINERVLSEARYLIKTEKTVREISKVFKVSKSTVHKDLHERLIKIDRNLYEDVDIRHIRGGEATRQKYQKLL